MLPAPENLDFEDGLTAWSYADDGASGRTSRVEWRQGAAAMIPAGGFIELRQEIAANDYRNRRVRLRAAVRPEVGAANLSGAIRLAAGNFYVRNIPLVERRIDVANGSATYDLVIDVPENSTKISYWFAASGQAALYIDDIEFDVVDDSVPVTVMPQRDVGDAE